MNDEESTGEIVKIYVTDRPRFLGLFHWGPAADGTIEASQNAGYFGIIGQVGPCRCGDPTHEFPQWYAVTPCIYVQLLGWMLTMRIPEFVAHAILWIKGPSND